MYSIFKRGFDFVLALLAIVVLSPLFLPACLVLWCTGEHKVFYFQERIGFHNRRFRLWKFATMFKNSPNMPGGLHTTRHDPRVLPFGHVLRATKINELPQLMNILLGDMAVVGPRPLVDKTFDPYPEHIKACIYNVRPGLTGIGSIVFRDEERLLSEGGLPPAEFYRRFISPAKGELELWYQRHMSMSVDLALIFLTAWVIFRPRSRLTENIFPSLPKINVPGLV